MYISLFLSRCHLLAVILSAQVTPIYSVEFFTCNSNPPGNSVYPVEPGSLGVLSGLHAQTAHCLVSSRSQYHQVWRQGRIHDTAHQGKVQHLLIFLIYQPFHPTYLRLGYKFVVTLRLKRFKDEYIILLIRVRCHIYLYSLFTIVIS